MESQVEDIVDAVILCIERVKLVDTEFVSWTHDVTEIMRSGVFMIRVVSYGYASKRGKIVGFTSITNLSGLDSDSLSPVLCKVIFSDGRMLELRPEVELYACLKELYPLIQIYRF
ncbi:MAG: hypothetical protein GXO32_06650 [Crenarchaeota archaeon]|nr:hypothetical protein [Thermoproteota archaeon]